MSTTQNSALASLTETYTDSENEEPYGEKEKPNVSFLLYCLPVVYFQFNSFLIDCRPQKKNLKSFHSIPTSSVPKKVCDL